MRKVGVSDQKLLRREIYNPNDYELRFELMLDQALYITGSGITLGPYIVHCKANDFCILNHGFYYGFAPGGRPVNVIMNFGRQIGIGNKVPSNPYGFNG